MWQLEIQYILSNARISHETKYNSPLETLVGFFIN